MERLGISTSVLRQKLKIKKKLLITSSLVKVRRFALPRFGTRAGSLAFSSSCPLVGDLERVQIPLPDPAWRSSPLIRGLLVLPLFSYVAWHSFGLDTQRRLEDSRAVY